MKYSTIDYKYFRSIARRPAARLFLLLFISSIFFTLSACSIHQLDIQQGNVITNDMTDKLKIGMDKGQVRFIMGTPLINDPFHKNRWDYVFSLDAENGKKESTHITVFFVDNKVSKFNGTVAQASTTQIPKTQALTTTSERIPPQTMTQENESEDPSKVATIESKDAEM
ncbi:MAG: outer membrane protein assembly factor BamE [Gammaproteobacteria bacterium]|nr:outer membrane protein assembly factor BamE [Gammaproteobacteria bacterium]